MKKLKLCFFLFFNFMILSMVTAQNNGQWNENGCGKIGYLPNDTIVVCNKTHCVQTRRLKVNGAEQIIELSPESCDTFVFQAPIWEAKTKPITNCGCDDQGWIEITDFPLPLLVVTWEYKDRHVYWKVEDVLISPLRIQYSLTTEKWVDEFTTSMVKGRYEVSKSGYYRLWADDSYSSIIFANLDPKEKLIYIDQYGRILNDYPTERGIYFIMKQGRVIKKIMIL